MCYNFISLIHLRHYSYISGSVEPLVTVFEKRMGVLLESFGRIYPLCMVAWSLFIALNVHHHLFDSLSHLLSHCRGLYSRTWRRLRFNEDGEGEEVGVDGRRVVVKGHMILQRECATIERGQPLGESVVPLARHFSSKDLHASSSASSLLLGHYPTPTKVPHTDPSSSSSVDPLLDSRITAVRPPGGEPVPGSGSSKDLESAALSRAGVSRSGSVNTPACSHTRTTTASLLLLAVPGSPSGLLQGALQVLPPLPRQQQQQVWQRDWGWRAASSRAQQATCSLWVGRSQGRPLCRAVPSCSLKPPLPLSLPGYRPSAPLLTPPHITHLLLLLLLPVAPHRPDPSRLPHSSPVLGLGSAAMVSTP
ncbi:hypothetical protein CLOP_g12876 [Closterium sp. NIES-67]|nr:hypothetical protein CLOP_g12876 [Closterium sp. NIES-67]